MQQWCRMPRHPCRFSGKDVSPSARKIAAVQACLSYPWIANQRADAASSQCANRECAASDQASDKAFSQRKAASVLLHDNGSGSCGACVGNPLPQYAQNQVILDQCLAVYEDSIFFIASNSFLFDQPSFLFHLPVSVVWASLFYYDIFHKFFQGGFQNVKYKKMGINEPYRRVNEIIPPMARYSAALLEIVFFYTVPRQCAV